MSDAARIEELEQQLASARDIIAGLDDLIGRAAKASVDELDSDLAYKIDCLNGCFACGQHPDTHCGECGECPCDCAEADLLRRAAAHARVVGDAGVPGALVAMLECASRMDEPLDRESVASDQCGWCGYSHFTAIAQAILGEGA